MAAAIQTKMMGKRIPVVANAWLIHSVCLRTVKDFKCFLSELEKFRTFVHPANQYKRKNSIEMRFICSKYITYKNKYEVFMSVHS